jgi:RHS repeat-associated protein
VGVVTQTDYLYTGGPVKQTLIQNENGIAVSETTPTYGPAGEVKEVKANTHTQATYAYDAAYRVVTEGDGNPGNTTAYAYDSAGRLRVTTYPRISGMAPSWDTLTTDYSQYPTSGILTQIDGGRNLTTTQTYGSQAGLLTQATVKLTNTETLAAPTSNYLYDPFNRLLSAETVGVGTETYGYDNGTDLLTSQTTTYSGMTGSASLNYFYRADGQRNQVFSPTTNTWLQYDYELDGRPTGVRDRVSKKAFGWAFDPRTGRLGKAVRPGGSQTTFEYNPRDLLSGVSHYRWDPVAGTLAAGHYGGMLYDAAANRTQMALTGSATTRTLNYTYDTSTLGGRLTLEQETRNGSPTLIVNDYDYDPAGNLKMLRNQNPLQTYTAFDPGNRNPNYTYDGAGNLVGYEGLWSLGARSVEYDGRDHPVRFSREDAQGVSVVQLTAAYREDGLRAWKQVGTNGARTYYLYDGTDPVAELGSDGLSKAGNVFGATGLLARREKVSGSWVTTDYEFDPQGSVLQRLDGNGWAVGDEEGYDAYGKQVLPTNAGQVGNGSPWGYNAQSGYYTDRETGLILCTYRYYDPEEGRFLNRDPIGYEGGSNLYAYVGGNPINNVDPTGTQSYPDPNNNWQTHLHQDREDRYDHLGEEDEGVPGVEEETPFGPRFAEEAQIRVQRYNLFKNLQEGIKSRFVPNRRMVLYSDKQERVIYAVGAIRAGDIGKGTSTNAASRSFARKRGYNTDDAGHVIGKQLGGLGGAKSGNIFPQNRSVNRGEYAQFENEIAEHVKSTGQSVPVNIIFVYKGGSARPIRVKYNAIINGKVHSRIFDNPR